MCNQDIPKPTSLILCGPIRSNPMYLHAVHVEPVSTTKIFTLDTSMFKHVTLNK